MLLKQTHTHKPTGKNIQDHGTAGQKTENTNIKCVIEATEQRFT